MLESGPGDDLRSYAVRCARLAGPEGDIEGVITVAVDVTDLVRSGRQAGELLARNATRCTKPKPPISASGSHTNSAPASPRA